MRINYENKVRYILHSNYENKEYTKSIIIQLCGLGYSKLFD